MNPLLPTSRWKSISAFNRLHTRLIFYSFPLLFGFFAQNALAQTHLPECTASVPFFNLDLSATPDMSYTTPEVVRQPGCCGDGDNYISFYVVLNPNVAQFEIVVAPGYADPGGSGNYNIISGGDLVTPGSCGTQIPGGAPICITGPGPHKIIYSKPGKNKIKYIFRQIPRPIFPADQSTRIGCSLPLSIFGLNNITMTSINSSTGNTTPGAYNSLLSCTNCSNPSFSPGLGTPSWIDYRICGTPQAAACGTFQSCDTVRLYTYGALAVTSSPNPATFCQGGSGVLLTASATGGDGNYSYRWKNSSGVIVSTSSTYTATTSGIFTAEVTDGLSTATCPDAFVSVPVTIATTPVVTAGVDQIVCATSPTVLLHATSTTGSGIWTGGSGTFQPNATSLIASYTPSAAEINNGSVPLTFTSTGAGGGCLNSNDVMTISFSDTVFSQPMAAPIACYNGSTTINAGQSGGTAPFSYSWSTGSSGNSISATAGTYLLTVTDQYGCYDITPITISQPSPLALNLSTTTANSPVCDGTASVAISGGTAPYSILWDDNQTTPTATSLCEGIIEVVVVDNNGCSITQSTVVNNVFCNAFDVGITSSTDVSCHNGTDGSATVGIVSGGTPLYTYSWNTSPVQTGATANNLASGTYSVLVTDGSGCQDVAAITILQPTIITNTMTHVDASSIGGSDGSATANPLGGTPGYTYLWTPGGQTTQTASNLSSAVGGVVYHVAITDANSCLMNDSVRVNQPPCNDFIASVNATNVSCNGSTNGAAALVIANGTSPFSISWSNGVNNAMSISSLPAGNYSVTVTDSKNCSTFSNFAIIQPAPLSISLVPTNVSCNSAANGTIDLTVSGGTYPYTFSWSLGGNVIANHEDLTHLAPGTYSIVVTDAKGCSISGSMGITQPAAITASYTYSDNPCFGNSLGAVDLTVAGGSSPYTYDWAGPSGFTATTQDISGLVSGLYQMTITDLHGCSTVLPVDVFINQPVILSALASMSMQVSCNGGSNGSIAITTQGGTTPYSYAWTGPGSYSSSVEDISGLMAGTYQATVTDAHGCSTTASATVTTVLDIVPPVVSCTTNKSVFTSSSSCTYIVPNTSWNASATDDCLLASLVYTLSGATTGAGTSLNGVAFNKGVTTVTWVATDGLGNTDTCTFTVTVTDNVNPVITQCGPAAPASVLANTGVCTYTNSGTAWNVVATDNCAVVSVSYTLSGATTGSGTSLNGVSFNLGITTINWTVSDAAGNSASCSSTVTVSDNQVPSILSCGANGTQNVLANAGVCTYTKVGTSWNATASDNCSVTSIVYTLSGATTGTGTSLNGVVFNQGTTLVTWRATDGSGNFSICTFNVIVGDNQNPSITNCLAIGTPVVNANTGVCTYTHASNSWNAVATDNCGVISLVYNLSGATTGSGTSLNGVQFNLGTTIVSWTATDAAGNNAICIFTVTVNDIQVPAILSCGASGNQSVLANSGVCTYTQSSNAWNASASDNCSVASIVYVLTGATTGTGTSLNGVAFNLGTTTVTWTATDGSGNTTSCSFNVLVSDNQVPSIVSCGASGTQNVLANVGVCTYTHSGTAWNATATDNCSVASITYTLSGATTGTGTSLNGVVFNQGTTTVTWRATDGSGNFSICTFNVIVGDNQNPVITNCSAIGNQIVNANTGVCTYTHSNNSWNAVATDNCTVSSIVYSLTGATTGSGISLNGVQFNLGITTVTWTATDAAGNKATCIFTVTVNDTQNPVILSCGAVGNQSVAANSGVCTYTQSSNAWNASASDNCSVASVVYVLTGATTGSGTSLNGKVFNLGTTTVTWTATDGSGNTSSCSFNVLVIDTQNPVILSCGASGNQSVVANTGVCTYTNVGNGWNASASDNCSVVSILYVLTGATTGTGTSLNGKVFNLGTTTVTWTATDGSGNTSSCSFNVVVSDNQVPNILSCGASGNQNVLANAGVCTYTHSGIAWNATASDNCSVASVVYTLSGATTGTGTSLNGVVFNQGTTLVTWRATDGSGNFSICTFNVIVGDNQNPVITNCSAIGNQVVNANTGLCSYTHSSNSWNALATDNCTVSSIVYTLSGATTGTGTSLNGIQFNLGLTTVTWVATDAAGNTATCIFTVTVNDTQNPVILSCGAVGNQSVVVDPSQCSFTQSSNAWNASANDNCSVASVVYVLSGATTGSGTSLAGVSFNLGTTTVTWTATDGSGNTSSCSFNVLVSDTQLPVITSCGAAGNLEVTTDEDFCTYTQVGNGWNASATDNCTITSLTYVLTGATTGTGTSLNGVVFNQGTTTVTWTAVDTANNQSQCQFTVTVIDDEDPVIVNCPEPIVQNSDTGDCGAIVSWVVPSFTDNCGAGIIGTASPGTYFPVGVSSVSYAVIDNTGNQAICTFSITVVDAEAPAISCPDTVATCDPLVTYDLPSTSDNCGVASLVQTAGLPSGSNFPVGVTINTFLVTDIHGNTSECSFTVRIYPTPISGTVVDQVSCNGFGDASVDLQITNGTAPYQTDWSNNLSSEDLTDLTPGTYTVAITDFYGCTTADTVVITEPEVLSIAVEEHQLSCYNSNDGSIQTSVSGGTEPYSYNWLNGPQTPDLSDLAIGDYNLTVTDANGCLLAYSATISQPDSLMLEAVINDATCNAANGSIQTQVTGGTTPYSYHWSNGSANEDLNNVPEGGYNVLVTDAHGCQVGYSGVVRSVNNLDASAVITDVSCYGGKNGEATVIISNGNQPYTYAWSNGWDGAHQTGLSEGAYTVVITDEFGCSDTVNIVIDQPDSIIIDLTLSSYLLGYNVSTYDSSDGSISAVVSGGTVPYSYFWSTTDTTSYIDDLIAGEYLLIVTDDNGCTATALVELTQPDVLEMPQGFSPNADGDNDYFVVHGIKSYPDNTIKVFNRWGNIVYQKNGYADEWYGENNSGEELPDATYFVILDVVVGGKEKVLQGYVDLRRK